MRCGHCGYSLAGLSLRTCCPECGSVERDRADAVEIGQLLRLKVRQSIWIPLPLALATVLLGLMHPLLAPLVGLFMITFVGIIAEDITRLRGFLHPEWTPSRWLATLVVLLAIYGTYFIGASLALWHVVHSPLIQNFF